MVGGWWFLVCGLRFEGCWLVVCCGCCCMVRVGSGLLLFVVCWVLFVVYVGPACG